MSAPAMPALDLLVGPVFIACTVNWFLFGAEIVQLYDYFILFNHKDRLYIKATVYIISVIEVVQTALVTHATWTMLINDWGSYSTFASTPWSSVPMSGLTAVVALLVQGYFARRIWLLGKTKLAMAISLLVMVLALLQCGFGIAGSVQYGLASRDPRKWPDMTITATVWSSGMLAGDIIVAMTMVFLLGRARRRSAVPSTQDLLDHLIMHTIESGLITAVVAAVELAMFIQYQTTYLFVCPLYVLGKLYYNVLLSSLNGRKRVRQTSEWTNSTGKSGGGNIHSIHAIQSGNHAGLVVKNGSVPHSIGIETSTGVQLGSYTSDFVEQDIQKGVKL